MNQSNLMIPQSSEADSSTTPPIHLDFAISRLSHFRSVIRDETRLVSKRGLLHLTHLANVHYSAVEGYRKIAVELALLTRLILSGQLKQTGTSSLPSRLYLARFKWLTCDTV